MLFLLLKSVDSSSQNYVWTQKASLPSQPRMGAAGFSIGNKGYAVGGYTGIAVLKETWEYDSQTNTWSQKADLPGSVRYNASGFAINNKGYVCLGWATTNGSVQLSDLWEYDQAGNTWTAKAPFPGGARYTASAFVIGNAAYVGLGYQPLYNDFYRYEPALNLWTQVASLPAGNERQSAGSFSLKGMGYISCGNKANAFYYNDTWQYNPANNQWIQKTDLPGLARLGPASFQIDNMGFIGIGSLNNTLMTDSYFYNDSMNNWIAAPPFPGILRENPTCWEFMGMAFLNFGKHSSTNIFLNDCWVLSDILSISEESSFMNVKIWPVPVTDMLNVLSPQVIRKLFIINTAGQVQIEISKPQEENIEIDLSKLTTGNYFLKLAGESGSAVFKIVKL